MKIQIDIPLAEIVRSDNHDVHIGPKELFQSLYDVCDANHSGCNVECPVWAANGGRAPVNGNNCSCFKDGKAMLTFLREKAS